MLTVLCVTLYWLGLSRAQELLQNADFESHNYHSNWQCSGCTLSSSSDRYHGQSSVKVSNRQHNWSGLGQHVAVKPLHTYIFSAHMKLLSNSHGHMYDKIQLIVSVTHSDGNVTYETAGVIPHAQKEFGWFEIGYDYRVPNNIHSLYTYIKIQATSVDYLVDNASFKELPTDNNWKTAANSRINHLRKRLITVHLNNSQHRDTTHLRVEVQQVKSKFAFGSVVDARMIVDNIHHNYQQFLYDNFEYAVLGNALKWRIMEWTQGHPDLDTPMRAVDSLRSKGMTVRGHNMFWGVPGHEPRWVDPMNSSQTLQAMHKHVNDVITRTRGSLIHWDVNNENLHGDFFEQHTGHANITMEMFDWIHQLEPGVKLFLNDYNVINSKTMTTAYKGQAERMRKANSPIYGVGLQCHMKGHNDMTTLKYRFDKIAEAGLPIWVTELTINDIDENRKADALEDLLVLSMSHPAVEGVVLWGYWDGRIWIHESALATGKDVTPNAAGRRYQQLYKESWRTHVNKPLTDNMHIPAFIGDYVLKVMNHGHVIQTHNFSLGKQGANININF